MEYNARENRNSPKTEYTTIMEKPHFQLERTGSELTFFPTCYELRKYIFVVRI